MASFQKNKTAVILFFLLVSVVALGWTLKPENESEYININPTVIIKDSIASVKAFQKVYKVLMSPRCVNCHPIGDVPLQGEDSHLHVMAPKRGIDGRGLYAMKCTNCHQTKNTPGLHTPPGNSDWHLPPADMKMVFEGRTAHQLAKQLMDPSKNGHMDINKLKKHADDAFVLAGWNPGEGRSLPPLTHAEFKKEWLTWLNNGAYAPAK
ncbi:hypothetical protein EKM05_02780 [Flavobacterium sp. GSP27]|uniref:Uncharacterized protein n=1 Tax=Flavobacterium bomense TaxID=2497483 RepID=A0A3S0PXZ1_9FLAO|nr:MULTISPECIES: hypothetical protein [Flavobacterium]RTY92123.1 hypothetical protein EKM01_05790 [Flavobacterium sp. RSP46]RTZ05821.1 hypothetical protein EKM03_08410 [Flavobacterium sp. GSP6]RTZ07037.1 hypothetical protein EKL98_03270 [Flavobacterium bomense]RTZ10834.1 hypothetical protein EKM05_02780 [Flavobacterium sp. GSP27]